MGVTVFDQEHQRLAARLSHIHATLLAKPDRAHAQRLLESLIQETRAHFDHEERVMEEVGFHGRVAHVAEHTALIQEANVMLLLFKSGAVLPHALPDFLKSWLILHAQVMDRQYTACLRRHGFR